MNRANKRTMLQAVGVISSNLQRDIGVIDQKVQQTDNDIERIEDMIEDLKQRKDVLMADDYMAFETVNVMSECMLHLSLAVAHMEQKASALRKARESVDEAVTEVNRFANAMTGIPLNE